MRDGAAEGEWGQIAYAVLLSKEVGLYPLHSEVRT